MSARYVSAAKRQRVAQFFKYRCAYCQTAQKIIGPLLEIDHIVPQAHGGSSDEENLATIHGKTPVGRATITALQMNHPEIVLVRQMWVRVGWHPPVD